jgi:hypothetical protein
MSELSEFDRDSLRFHKRILTGSKKHFCPEWDFMPIDETCKEFECCLCYPENYQEGLA